MPPPMYLLSNSSNDFSPKAINIHKVSDEDKNEKHNWITKMQRFKWKK